MTDDLRPHSCDHCQGADPTSCVFAPGGANELRRGYAEKTVSAWNEYAKHWRERAEKAEAEQEEEYQRAERLQEEISQLLDRCHSAERRRDAAESRLKHLLGVIAEYGDNPSRALRIVQREVSNGVVHRDIELSEARRERDALAVHLARAEAALAALSPPPESR